MVKRVSDDFNLAGGEPGILSSRKTRRDRSRYLNNVLAPESMGHRGRIGMCLGTKDNLRDAVAIAKVNENDATVVAAGIHPTAKSDTRSGVRFAQSAAMIRAITHKLKN